MKKVNQIYENADYEIRLKAPVLNVFLLFLTGMVILLTLVQLIDGFDLVDLLTNVVLVALFLSSWFILIKGNYAAASAVFMFGVVFFIGLSNTVDGYNGENAFAQRMLIYVSIYLLAIFLTARLKHLLIVLIIGTVMLIGNTGYLILTRGYTELSVSLGGQLMTSLTIYIIAVSFSLLFRRTIDRIITDAYARTEEARERADHMGHLAEEARDGLEIARTMEEQAEETASSIVQIEENVNGISNNVEMLTGQFDNSRNALEQIGENMTSLENVAADQSANITETGAALEEMVASINSVSQVIENKMRSVDKLHESADQGARVIGETSDSFKQVLEHLENVKKMITIISSIAAQTNLLAMNAAIEAAHAGDAGRGFAVVADEVRKLAESSGINAKQVGVTLKQLVDAIETTGTNVNNSGSTFSVISNEVRLVGDAMKEINNSVQELAAGSGEVLEATTSMNSLTGKVSENVSDVRAQEETAQESLKKLGDFIMNLGSSMGEIRAGTTHIRESSLELQSKSGHINEFVKEFGSKLEKN